MFKPKSFFFVILDFLKKSNAALRIETLKPTVLIQTVLAKKI